MDMDNNYDAFDNYVMKYDLTNDKLKYKYNHSYRVMKECENITKSLNYDNDDLYLSSLIGLLHDIGRFYQYSEFKTFKDGAYFDHADYACKILFDEGLIKKFDIEEEYYDVIKKAVINHNKYSISDVNEEEEIFCKIVRDADKLDILYAFSNDRILELLNNDECISNSVRNSFFEHKVIKNEEKKSVNDRVIGLLSFVYDLNYDYSKNKILKEKYIDKIYKYIKNKEIFKEYFDEARKYLKEEIC